MAAVDALTRAEQVKTSLLSYLSSALPVGNHASQRELGQELYERWRNDLFSGPFVEFLPRYEQGDSLDAAFGDLKDRRHPDYRFAQFMNPGLTWGDLDGRLSDYRRFRDRIWPRDSADAHNESAKTTIERLWKEKKLYRHQWDSFNRLIRQGRSIVVATPTGSGKTECFLVPLLHDLLTEPDERRKVAGVRALLVYPMNALVEDQMHRLRQYLFWINLACKDGRRDPQDRPAREVTFGRYTGDTPTGPTDRERKASDEAMPELGEVVYRNEMQEDPPDILITNFTMLEYMLLRGDDQRLFQRPDVFKFLVLDEVHTYSGTQGMEVALLLRRLHSFLRTRGLGTPVRFIGASATLPSGVRAREEAARFATALFGTPFVPDDIIRAEPAVPVSSELSAERRSRIMEGLLALPDSCPTVAGHLGLRPEPTEEVPETELATLGDLLGSARASDDIDIAEEVPRDWSAVFLASEAAELFRATLALRGCLRLADLNSELFGEHPSARVATEVLLRAVSSAQVGLRFHYFICEPAGAQVCLNPTCSPSLHDGWWSRLFVHHHTRCAGCDSYAYPLFLCRKCGYVYLEGWIREGRVELLPERDDGDDPASFERVLFRPAKPNVPESPDPDIAESSQHTLCLRCGMYMVAREDRNFALAAEHHRCSADSFLEIVAWTPRDGVLNQCLCCEQHWIKGNDVITPPAPSGYAASTVLVEELSRSLTDTRGNRGKLVSFSDSRQQAAQLAYRFQKTNREFTLRQLIFGALEHAGRALSTRELLDELYDRVRRDMRLWRLLLDDERRLSDSRTLQRTLATLVLRESVSAFLTLESQGLANVAAPAEVLLAAQNLVTGDRVFFDALTPPQRTAFVRFLLDWAMRFRYAVDTPSRTGVDIDWFWLVDRGILQMGSVRERQPNASYDVPFAVRKDDPRNRALNYSRRVLARKRGDPRWPSRHDLEDLRIALFAIWDNLLFPNAPKADAGGSAQSALLNFGSDDPTGARLKLNFDTLCWSVIAGQDSLHRCDACGRVNTYSIEDVCPIPDCAGFLKAIRATDLDHETFSPVRHYRRLATRSVHPLRVEEHTAEVAPRRRQEIERGFRESGEDGVDVVCGSTTFELGIDLGTLNGVFLSNLPPRVANYRQRAGRAGRRAGMTPFVLSYVRQRPHDQYFWPHFQGFIAGPLPVPRLSLSSPLVIARHGHAVLVAELLAQYRQKHRGALGLEGPPSDDFLEFALAQMVQADLRRKVECRESALARELEGCLAGVDGAPSPSSLVSDLTARLGELRDTLMPLRGEDGAISLLSDYGVLPSYAFPIYVDEMRLYAERPDRPPRSDLKLQRDRRISLTEYRPGRVIVAGKTVIRSQGLWAGAKQKGFCYCQNRNCAQLDFRPQAAGPCSACGGMRSTATALVPEGGFMGVVDERAIEDQDADLVRERGETYFDPASDPPPTYRDIGCALRIGVIEARMIRSARMRQLNPRPGSKKSLDLVMRDGVRDVGTPRVAPVRCFVLPTPEDERGQARSYHLMHEFTTDIVRIQVGRDGIGELLRSSERFVRAIAEHPDREAFYLDCLRRTFAEALVVAGSIMLDVDPSEIGVTFHAAAAQSLGREVILFDTAPGGAGYAQQLADQIQRLFEQAHAVVARCDCGDSCYGCLRTYHNQMHHRRLDRKLLEDGLGRFTSENWA